jgi:amino acid adenylation domain-containing protein
MAPSPEPVRTNAPAPPHPGSSLSFPHEDTLQPAHTRFEQQARITPHKIAVTTPAHSASYQELKRQADTITHYLKQSTTNAGSLALLIEDAPSMAAAMLAALKIGRPFINLDPHYPADRIAYILKDSQATHILTSSALLNSLPPQSNATSDILLLDTLTPPSNPSPPTPATQPNTPAYIIYTSGSTGQPKGVVHTHQSLLHNIRNYTHLVQITPEDQISNLHSFSFSTAIMEIFLALLNGASSHHWPLAKLGFNGLANYMTRNHLSIVCWIPTPLRQFAASLPDNVTIPSARIAMIGSEPVTSKDVQICRQLFGAECTVMNRVGTTETGNFRSYFVPPNHRNLPAFLPAGYAVPDTETILLNEELQPITEPNQTGTIAVRTPCLATGYWQKPDLTEKSFIPDPRSNGHRLYVTGDLGRLSADGCLTFLGRTDSQIKLNGLRIELSEIESHLLNHPQISSAVVLLKTPNNGNPRLVAYLTTPNSNHPTPIELSSHLSSSLPHYMVPTAFVFLDQMPVTPSGKIDRKALPNPPQDQPTPNNTASTDTEFRLLKTWETFFPSENLNADTDFFQIGGNSLLAASLMLKVETDLGKRLPLSSLLHAPTVRQLAALVDQQSQPDWSPLVPFQTTGSSPPLFFVHGHMGNVIGFAPLAKSLGPNQPFFALQARGLDGKTEPFTNFIDMARYYVDAIRTLQPHGPYHLGGFCFGGTLAIEMARLLQQKGEPVPIVITVQSRTLSYPQFSPNTSPLTKITSRIVRRLQSETAAITERGKTPLLRHLADRCQRIHILLIAKIEPRTLPLLRKIGYHRESSSATRQIHLEHCHRRAFRSHHTLPYNGNVAVIRAERQPLGIQPDPSMGWKHIVQGKLFTHSIPGHELGMFNPPRVHLLANLIRPYLTPSL